MRFFYSISNECTPISPKDILIAICIFVLTFITYFNSIILYNSSAETRWFIPVALSIIREGNVELDEYAQSEGIKNPNFSYTYDIINGHIYNRCPIGTSMIAIPFVFIIDRFLNQILGLNLEDFLQFDPSRIEVFISSLIVVITVVLLYYLFRIFLNRGRSIFLTFIFAFCTSSWSLVSRSLWQHGPSMLILTFSLYLILLAKRNPWLIQFVGIPLAFSYVIRPTNGISLFVFTIYAFFKFRRYFLLYLTWAAIVLVPFFRFNLSIYHSFVSPYYNLHELVLSKNCFEAFCGILFSPGKGLLFFTPILLFSIYGVIIKVKSNKFDSLDFSLISIIVVFLIGASFHYKWWGGWFFGSRFFVDSLPYFMYFLIPVVGYIFKLETKKQAYLTIFFLLFTLCSFFIHLRGATSYGPYEWCYNPTNIDNDKPRVWNLKDISFLRPIKKSL